MDAFFASVELLSYPQLRGQAVVVGGRNSAVTTSAADGNHCFQILKDYTGRGVVTTSTYEARALGVFSGMGLMKSAALAPAAILLPANFEAYRLYSRKFKAAVASIAPLIEDRGIDEIYIDLTDIDQASLPLAMRIKQAVKDATGLTCSIGITPNKLLSKIASDLNKPEGISILSEQDISTKIWPLPAKKINGIGPKANEKLTALGITTIGELATAPLELLVQHFGKTTGFWMNQASQGFDNRPLVIESEPKSISRETTFERDLHAKADRNELSAIFTGLCMRLADDLQRKGYAAKTLGIKLKYSDFQVVTRDVTAGKALQFGPDIRSATQACLKRVPLDQRIRLLGVRASGLIPLEDLKESADPEQSQLPFELD